MADPNHAKTLRCSSCGYENRSGTRSCNLCGSFLYAAARAEEAAESAQDEAAEPAEVPPPEEVPELRQPEAPMPRVSVSLDDEGDDQAGIPDMYSAPSTPAPAMRASISLTDDDPPAESTAPAGGIPAAPAAPAAPALSLRTDAAPQPPAGLSTVTADLDVAAPRRDLAPPPPRPAEPQQSYTYQLNREQRMTELRKEREFKARLWRRWLGHGVTGIILCFGINLVGGLPGSIHPLSLILNAMGATVFGFPLGFCVSRFNAGLFKGVLIGALFGGFYMLPLVLIVAVAGGGGFGMFVFVLGMLSGVIPGGLLGWHVDMDQ